jgi:predicted TIM-barrel fold metal-dependent hydrolase
MEARHGGSVVVDSDQHLFETRTMWRDFCEPGDRSRALEFVDDDAGNPWLTWQGHRMALADVTVPGESERVGSRLQRALAGLPPETSYDEELEPVHWDPVARVRALDGIGVDESVVFPNYGLVWERTLAGDLRATKANMAAWNRWAGVVASEGGGRLHPVGHVTLRDLDWLEGQLSSMSESGLRLAMVSPGLVDGRPLSHPSHDRAWAAFVDHGITPVFHVSSAGRPFDEAWYESDPHPSNPVLSSVFLWASPALAIADLALNGVFARHPDLRIGVMELSAIWLPMFLQYLDGGYRFHRRLQGSSIVELEEPPSHYVRRHVRVAAFAYEGPSRLAERSGDIFMFCSDYPHSEGTATPLDDYRAASAGRSDPDSSEGLFADNVRWLLRL